MNIRRLLTVAGMLTTVVVLAQAQTQPPEPPATRLRNPAVVRSTIGGESHHSYVIRAAKGKTMTVQLSWRREGDNNAQFTISYMPGYFGVEDVTFGKWSKDERRWTGKIPKTGNYYIYVVAHPVARYTLRVTIR